MPRNKQIREISMPSLELVSNQRLANTLGISKQSYKKRFGTEENLQDNQESLTKQINGTGSAQISQRRQ